MECVIYMRWSSAEQGKGSSLERQKKDCYAHAEAKGWTVIEEFVDDGVSAFKGVHANTGALGQFVRNVDNGLYPDGVILLCEKLDRLSRQKPSQVFVWMMQLTEAGVTVATVDGAREYAKGGFDMAAIIEVVVKAQLSHEESEKKSQRLSAAWAAKRSRLNSGERFVMSRRTPAWLEVVGNPAAFVPIDERVSVVRRIFEETIAGFGKHHIARNLNRDKIPTFGRASAWHASYIQKILRNAAVLGDFQPASKPRGNAREPVGDIIKGYYPPIIDEELYRRAHASMAERSRAHTGRGRKLVNLLSGIARCQHCREKMTLRAKGRKQRADGSWVDEDYLVCNGYQRGMGCDNSMHFNYRLWAGGVLDFLMYEAFKNESFASHAEVKVVEIELAKKERELKALQQKAERALEIAVSSKRKEPKDLWLELVAETDHLELQVTSLSEQLATIRGGASPTEHQANIDKLRDSLDAENEDVRHEARARVMAAIDALIDDLAFIGEGTGGLKLYYANYCAEMDYNDVHNAMEWTRTPLAGN